VVPLGKPKFPTASSKYAWLLLFYDKDKAQRDRTTKQYVSLAKELSEVVLKKAKHVKNGVIFKVGAVDCSGKSLQFCQSKLDTQGLDLPVFATVLSGTVGIVDDNTNTKTLHEYATRALLKEGSIVNINSVQHIQSRLLAYSPTPGHPTVAIMLLSEKYEPSPLYASLAYRHRADGFASFGESRGKNLQLGRQFSVKTYPLLVALFGNEEKMERFERYNGSSMDSESLSIWLNGLTKKHFKSQFKNNRKKKPRR